MSSCTIGVGVDAGADAVDELEDERDDKLLEDEAACRRELRRELAVFVASGSAGRVPAGLSDEETLEVSDC